MKLFIIRILQVASHSIHGTHWGPVAHHMPYPSITPTHLLKFFHWKIEYLCLLDAYQASKALSKCDFLFFNIEWDHPSLMLLSYRFVAYHKLLQIPEVTTIAKHSQRLHNIVFSMIIKKLPYLKLWTIHCI